MYYETEIAVVKELRQQLAECRAQHERDVACAIQSKDKWKERASEYKMRLIKLERELAECRNELEEAIRDNQKMWGWRRRAQDYLEGWESCQEKLEQARASALADLAAGKIKLETYVGGTKARLMAEDIYQHDLEQARAEGAAEQRERDCAMVCRYCHLGIPVIKEGKKWLHRNETEGGVVTTPCWAAAIRNQEAE